MKEMKKLIDIYLPHYDFREVHHISIAQPIEKTYYAAKHLDFSKSSIIKFLFKLRRLPVTDYTLTGLTRQLHFTFLDEIPNHEFLIGFGMNKKVEKIENPIDFISNENGYAAKVVWNFYFEKIAEGQYNVSTETRVKLYSRKKKTVFSIYWFFIKPFSGLTRIIMLNQIKTQSSTNENIQKGN